MANTLSSFEQSNMLSTIDTSNKKLQGIPEVYGYDVVEDQDHDILNQDSIDHIRNYFDNKEKDTISISQKTLLLSQRANTGYSVNNVSVVVNIVIFIIFLLIMWDFLSKK